MSIDKKKDIILIIDDNENDYIIIKKYIGDKYNVVYNDGQDDVLSAIEKHQPQGILLDYNLGIKDGINVLQDIKEKSIFADISVIMLTNERNPNVIIQALKYNATNYLVKDEITREDINLAIKSSITETKLKKQMEEKQDEILELSRTDDLTGLYNRRFFISKIEDEINRSKRGKDIFSISMFDLDYFKQINDNYGHIIGDEVLKVVADAINKNVRCTDYACRYGGDEYIIALLELSGSQYTDVLEKHLQKLFEIKLTIEKDIKTYVNNNAKINNQHLKTTVSIGTSFYSGADEDFYHLFKKADEAMYKVKELGRNGIGYYCFQRDSVEVRK